MRNQTLVFSSSGVEGYGNDISYKLLLDLKGQKGERNVDHHLQPLSTVIITVKEF